MGSIIKNNSTKRKQKQDVHRPRHRARPLRHMLRQKTASGTCAPRCMSRLRLHAPCMYRGRGDLLSKQRLLRRCTDYQTSLVRLHLTAEKAYTGVDEFTSTTVV